ncbi:MAG: hypothetical protein F6K26_16095 [Moorea sp. SIO2I5]|nr:hypothetical protein [Moorena sp. SIO2I5]
MRPKGGLLAHWKTHQSANLILNGKSAPIESMGLVTLDGNQAKPSYQLYRLYFRLAVAR